MIMDLHIHEQRNSSDSKIDLDQIIQEAKDKGLNGICITDHDTLGLRKKQNDLMKKYDFLIIIGVEIYTLDGDLLCFGIDEMPKKRMSAQDTLEFVHKRGGICIAAHPYRKNNRGLKDTLYTLKGLDAIEVMNGRTDYLDNQRALTAAQTLKITMTGGSDTHQSGEVGTYVTRFDQRINSEIDFLDALRKGRCHYDHIKEIRTA